MLWKDIWDSAILEAEMQIPEKYAQKWFSEGKHELTMLYDSARDRSSITMDVTDEKLDYDLPKGCLKVIKVLDDNNEHYPLYYANVADRIIHFKHKGKYTVQYLYESADFKGATLEPELRDEYCTCLAKYIASKQLKTLKPARAQELYGAFLSDAFTVNVSLKRSTRSNNSRPVTSFR